jgi:Flp pilus assembly protein TadG
MLLSRFVRDCRAGVAPLLALAIIPLMGAAGAAVDYSRANSARSAMQGALDAAALAMAKQGLSNSSITQQAKTFFDGNFVRPEVENVQVSAALSPVSGGIMLTASASGSVSTQMLGVMGFSNIAISTKSGVVVTADSLGCVLSLNPSASAALTGKGSTSVDLKGCSLYDNSVNATAMTVGGSANISALSVGVVGGISGADKLITTDGVLTGIGAVTDPYAGATFPTAGTCSANNFKANKDEKISPGVYCGGISVNAGAELKLDPGIYYIDGGDFTVNGGGTVTGTGVTLVFTAKNRSDWPTATINGGATINLTPPTSGPTAGIVMFGDRNMPVGTSYKLDGGANQYLAGAIYFPQGAVEFAGGGVATSTSCTKIIGNTVAFVGNSSLAINCSGYNTKDFGAWSVRLVL